MLIKSEKHNPNYLAKIVKLGSPQKHSNADRLLCWTIDFQNVITNLDYKEGDTVIYFPVECAINKEFISYLNSFEDKSSNIDTEKKGFFNKHARVRAISLRGEKSQGFIIGYETFTGWLIYKKQNVSISFEPGLEFDSYDDLIICQKYVPRISNTPGSGNKSDKKVVKRISRLVENQFRLHNDTENLRKNVDKIQPGDYIGVHYKKHGTSWVVGNVLTKKKLTWVEKLLMKLGINVNDEVYDYVYSSRKVVKNEYETKDHNHFFGYDLWADIKDQIKDIIPKGYTLYGECIGYDKNGKAIQKDYDYGCEPGKNKIYVYRITITNKDGQVLELDDRQIRDFCNKNGLLFSDTFIYYGRAVDMYKDLSIFDHWHQNFVLRLQKDYNNKDCFMCKNPVPEEGIVVRVQSSSDYTAYKLKSARFLEKETIDLDNEILDTETLQNELIEC